MTVESDAPTLFMLCQNYLQHEGDMNRLLPADWAGRGSDQTNSGIIASQFVASVVASGTPDAASRALRQLYAMGELAAASSVLALASMGTDLQNFDQAKLDLIEPLPSDHSLDGEVVVFWSRGFETIANHVCAQLKRGSSHRYITVEIPPCIDVTDASDDRWRAAEKVVRPNFVHSSIGAWIYVGTTGHDMGTALALAAIAGRSLLVLSDTKTATGESASITNIEHNRGVVGQSRLPSSVLNHRLISGFDDTGHLLSELASIGGKNLLRQCVTLSKQPTPDTYHLLRIVKWMVRFGPVTAESVLMLFEQGYQRLPSPRERRVIAGILQRYGQVDAALEVLVQGTARAIGTQEGLELYASLLFDLAHFEELAELATHDIKSTKVDVLKHESRCALVLEKHAAADRLSPSEPAQRVSSKSQQIDRVVCFLHASAPYQSGGYAIRAQGLLEALSERHELFAVTRPGFPNDLPKIAESISLPATTTVAGVSYRHMPTEHPRVRGEMQYMLEAVEHFSKVLHELRPDVVHVRSTYLVALPGVIAARRLGIPVLYEVSGFWELVYEGRHLLPGQEGRRRRTIRLEEAVARAVDGAVTMTQEMASILISRGISPRNVRLAPNAVPESSVPDVDEPRRRDGLLDRLGWPHDVPVIGYVGSFVDYEGLDVLVSALEIIMHRGVAFRTVLVGSGSELSAVREQIVESGLEELSHIPGRVPHDEAVAYYELIDICAFPRHETPATRAVSPLKPFEALVSGKAIVVSALPALSEIVGGGERGMIVPPGDASALADALQRLIEDSALRAEFGRRGRAHVSVHNNWERVSRTVSNSYQNAIEASRRPKQSSGASDDPSQIPQQGE